MPTQYVTVSLVLGEPRREWCERCLTSAVVAVSILAVLPTGVSTVGELCGCTRCDPGLMRRGVVFATWPEGGDG